MFAFAATDLQTVSRLQGEAQLYLLNRSAADDRESVADTYVDAALSLVEAGYGRHSHEWVALSRAFDVVAAGLPAVSLRKPVSLRKRRIPTADVALRSGLPVGMPVTGAPVCRDDNGREIRF